MFRALLTSLVLALGASPALAQSGGVSFGTPLTPQVGQQYIVETFKDWQLRCVKQEEGKKEPCNLFQLVRNADGSPAAEFNVIALPAGQLAVAAATVVTPLGTLLQSGVVFAIDGANPRGYPFGWCLKQGCFARMGFTSPELDAMKKGAQGVLRITSIRDPENPQDYTVSLAGFTAAFEALQARR